MKETKVYVDKLPKSCWDCFCQDNENGRCKILEKYTDYVPKDCPLIDIKDHNRELVAKVLERVSKELENETETYCEIRQCTSPHYQGDYVWFNYVKFRKFAEQLKKEFEDE